MKKILTYFLFVFALSIMLLKPQMHKVEAAIETKSYSLITIADGHIRGGTYADLNFGRNSNMSVRYRSDLGDNYYESYMKFTIPSNATNITKANLVLTYQSVPTNIVGRSYTIYTVDSDWNEGSGNASGVENDTQENKITYNNMPIVIPENNSIVFEITGETPIQYDTLTIDIKSLVNTYIENYAVKDSPTNISLKIVSNATENETGVNFCTKEHTKGAGPALDITLDVEKEEVIPTEIYSGLNYLTERITNKTGLDSSIHTLEIDSSSSLTVITGVPGNEVPLKAGYRQTPSEMAVAAQEDGYNVLAAINADFFRINEDDAIQPRGLTIKDGELLTPINEWTFFGIKKDGTPIIGDPSVYETVKDDLQHAVGGDSGYLVKDGIAITTDAEGGCHSEDSPNPRTAIGLKEDGSIVMVVVDGRTEISNGLVLTDLAQYMLSRGCVTAINLDGGGSSSMSIKNFETNTFAPVNIPSDATGERQVGNTLLVIDPLTSVMTSELNSLINEATNIMNNSQYGNEIGKYPIEQKNILNIAIVNAKAALVNEEKTQSSIDQAVIDLNNAIKDFRNSIITKIFDELNTLIDEANLLFSNAIFGTDIGNYPVEQEDLMKDAINHANEIVTNDETTQTDIDEEIILLSNIIDNFKASIIILETEELENKIEEAYSLMDNAIYGENVDEYPYESGIILNTEIVKAKEVLNNEDSKQIDVDNAVNSLVVSMNEFTNSKIKTTTSELSELVERVEYKLLDITFDENIGNYPKSQEEIINTALAEAKAILNNPDATQEEINAAIDSLNSKLEDLNKSFISNIDNQSSDEVDNNQNESIAQWITIGFASGIVISTIGYFLFSFIKSKKIGN